MVLISLKELSGGVLDWLVLVEDSHDLAPVRHVFAVHETHVATWVKFKGNDGVSHGCLDPSRILYISQGVFDSHK